MHFFEPNYRVLSIEAQARNLYNQDMRQIFSFEESKRSDHTLRENKLWNLRDIKYN